MLRNAAKTVFVLWLGALLALSQLGLAASALAACAATGHADCTCGSCAPGCKCCLKSGSEEPAPAPAPASSPAPQTEFMGAILHLAFKLAPQIRDASLVAATGILSASVSPVPIFTRDCSYLI